MPGNCSIIENHREGFTNTSMLGFFPDPYLDELLYSACARYANRTQYPNKQSAMIELAGNRGSAAMVDFPTHLDYLISILPTSHQYSVEQLINENTLLAFHEPFLPQERVGIIRKDMKGDSYNKMHLRIGTKVKQIENPKFLRYCPLCISDDRRRLGETYWHRIHQLGGIVVCPIHQCFLKNSSIDLGRTSSRYFHNAEEIICGKIEEAEFIDSDNKCHQILLKIAQDAQWLLTNPELSIYSHIVQERYFNLLLRQGFAYYNGRIKYTKLIEAIDYFFPPEVFSSVGRVSTKKNWIVKLTHPGNINITYHPIRHLLFITFLGLTAKDFFTSFVEFKPFGDPPYPCLNITCKDYKKLKIQEREIFDNISKNPDKQGIPLGVFRCDCGFAYQRLGPDKSSADKYKYNLVKEYGDVWDSKFGKLWADLSLTLIEIARRTKICSTSVPRQAIRLKLPMNTENARKIEGYQRHRNPDVSFSEMRNNYREKWIQIRSVYSNLTRKQLMDIENFLYSWLKKNDSEWFKRNLPSPTRISRTGRVTDWKLIDSQLSQKVEIACQEILKSPKFPIRISISEILRRIGKQSWFDKRKQKLPKTNETVNEKYESLEDFMLRKIEWTKKEFIKEKKIPTINQFQTRAVVRNSTSFNSSKIQEYIKNSIIQIKESLNS